MPFELRGNCIWKTDPEELVECFDTHEIAVSELAALQANVSDAQESIVRRYQEAALAPTGDTPMTGKSWDVTIMGPSSPDDIVTVDGQKYLKSKNKRLYNLKGLENSVTQGVWNDIQVFDNHLTDAEFEQRQGMRSADSELLGAIVSPYWDAETSSIKGTHKIIKEDLSQKILNAHDADILNIFGLSVDTKPIYGKEIKIGDTYYPVIDKIEEATSIDLVSKPAAGGKFNRVLAAENNQESKGNQREVETMNEEEVKALIGKAVIDTLNAKEEEAKIKAEEKAIEEEEAERLRLEEEEAKKDEADQPELVPVAQVEELDAKFQALESRTLLRESLVESNLSATGQAIVKQAFSNRVFEAKELEDMIKVTREAEIAKDGTGRAVESGSQRGIVAAGSNEDDKLTVDFMRLMMRNDFRGLEHSKDQVTIERLPEAYNTWKNTGKEMSRVPKLSEWLYQALGGDPLIDQRAYEAVTTSSMSTIVKNTVNLMVANDYSKREQWWDPIVKTDEVETIDDATMARLYGLDTLDVVDEGGPYTELTWQDEEETSSFVKRGNYVGVTLEAMLKDKTNSIRTIPQRLSNSWFNSISLRVAAVFTNNSNIGPVLSDTGALFNATATTTLGGHANLLTAALSFTSFSAARTAMMKQTDQPLGVGARLGTETKPRYLLVPIDLETTADQIRNSEHIPGSANNDVNPFFQKFDIIVVPRWTDTDDWALVADPNITPAIWLIFVRGNTVPSIFTADNESAGAMFTNDQLRWKVRQMTYRFSATYDNAPVSDFRGLHKSNV